MPKLMVIEGAQAGASFNLPGPSTYVGRRNGALELSDSRTLASRQISIIEQGDRFELKRVGHIRLLLVNGIMVETATLRHGDIITLDELAIVFVSDEVQSTRLLRAEPEAGPVVSHLPEDTSSHAILEAASHIEDPPEGLTETQIQHRQRPYADPQAVLKQLENESDSNRRLAALFKVSTAVSAILDLSELLPKVLDLIFEEVPAGRGSILLFDKESRRLKTMATKVRGQEVGRSHPVISRTIVKEVLRTRDSLLTTDAMADERFDLGASIIQKSIRSAMCVPLLRQERLLGIIFVDNSERTKAFTREDLDLMTGIAMQASLAIDNARLYQEVGDRERLKFEVDLASSIQKRLLPKRLPRSREIEVYGKMIPAKEVGGDYFDFQIDQKQAILHILIGDVSGKGLPAGLVMAMARSYFRPLSLYTTSPREILSQVNGFLFEDTNREMFISTLLMCWHEREKKFIYSGAGHEHLVVYRARSARSEAIRSGGVALGLVEDAAQYLKEHELCLEPGDGIVLYTDGITEAKAPDGELFGLDRLVDVADRYGHLSARELLEAILWEIKKFMGKSPQHDDITLVTIKKR